MEKIFGILGVVPELQKNKDDSLMDRMSHKFTVGLLIVFSAVVSAKQYVGEPINCWVPAHFSENWEDYTNSYCWIKNTYFLPFRNYIPMENEHDKRDMITYYQWVPLILLVQAFVFYLPCMVWRTFSTRSGVDINNIVDTCLTFQILEKASNKNKALDHLTMQMYRFVESQREYKAPMTISIKNVISRICCTCCGRRKGNYLVGLYILTKFLYIGNIIGQFFLMNAFLGTKYHEYGVKFFRMLYLQDTEEISVQAFPRVTMCDFKIRVLGNVQRYTVQCVLPINLFNEMIYLFLWWWMVFIAFASILSFITWLWKCLNQRDKTRFIKKHLLLMNRIEPRDGVEYNAEDAPLTVEFTECSEDFMRDPPSTEYEPERKASASTSTNVPDKYARLKELIREKHKDKYNEMRCQVSLNPRTEKDLLHEILQVAPEDARRTFKVSGQKGHDLVDTFMKTLHPDGIFVLRIVGNNTNSITITEVVCALWDRFCEKTYGKLI